MIIHNTHTCFNQSHRVLTSWLSIYLAKLERGQEREKKNKVDALGIIIN